MTAMTISDTERREVARKLRAAKRPSLMVLLNVLGVGGDGAFARLADLIEPPTQCPYYHSDRHRCSAYDDVVDRDALLALADEMDRRQHDVATAATDGVVDAWCLREYARRIREALGVSK